MTGHRSLAYRPDIDGLRAVAVLAVVFFHLGLPVKGGFVGVDVFFVISGYLIGSIILREIAAGTFTFSSFYERRVRRILPAPLAMLTAVSVLAYRWLLPKELIDFGRSLVAAALSVSNFYFWRQAGYFDAPAALKPLLHTWSLAVEEQFYIGLPLLLFGLRRLAPGRRAAVVAAAGAASLAVSAAGAHRFASSAFYLVPSRAWELLLGTVMSFQGWPRLRRGWARQAAGIAGLALIAFACLVYRTTTPFPGLAALPPCLGAALVIAAGRDGPHVVGRLLSIPPVVFIGKISYSLYLWHWPLIVFFGLGFKLINGLGRHQSQGLTFLLSLLVASASWSFVERPFRRRRKEASPRAVFRWAAAGLAGVAMVGAAAWLSRGAPARFSVEAQRVAGYLDDDSGHDPYRFGKCFLAPFDWPLSQFDFRTCLAEAPGKPTLLVLGDSHAAHLWWGLNAVYPEANVMQATAVGCKPVLNQRPRQYPGCSRLMAYMLRNFLPRHHVDAVLLEAHWDDGDVDNLSFTLAWLRAHGINVVLLGPMLQYDAPLPRLLAVALRDGDPSVPRAHRIAGFWRLDEQMRALARDVWRVPYVSMIRLLCRGGACSEYAAPGVPLQLDYGHLTEAGSVFVARRLRDSGALSARAGTGDARGGG